MRKMRRFILRMCSLIRAFALHWYIPWYPVILLADSEGPDQTARMRSLIWAFAVRKCPKHVFTWRGPVLRDLYIRQRYIQEDSLVIFFDAHIPNGKFNYAKV